MKKDKIRIFILETLLLLILFFALFALRIFTRGTLAIVIGLYAIIVSFLLKRRKIISKNKKQVNLLMFIFAMIYLGIFYLLGLYFGFLRSKITFSLNTIIKFIIPLGIIIISSECIRRLFLSHKLEFKIKETKIDFSTSFCYFAMVIIDVLIYTDVYDLFKLEGFLTLIGFVIFASISCNMLYNYIAKRYGVKGIIIYRLITILFIYVIPIKSDIYIFLRTFLRMLYPYIIYIILEKMFGVNDYNKGRIAKSNEIICNTVMIVLAALIVMLISCQFRYGIIVIGSGSMTGTLNKGDAVIFEKYTNQEIKKGQVIIFNYNNIQTIHRVIEIKKVNGEVRYYTKGDANESLDNDYRTDKDIHSLVYLRVKYIGYPTIWIKGLFEK